MSKIIEEASNKPNQATIAWLISLFSTTSAIIIWYWIRIHNYSFAYEISNPYFIDFLSIVAIIITILICAHLLYIIGSSKNKSYAGCFAFILTALCIIFSGLYILSSNIVMMVCSLLIILCHFKYNTHTKSIIPPIPIQKEDWLFRSRLFNRTHLQIRKHAINNRDGLTIGICGSWGSGKTFFINNLLSKLAQPNNTTENDKSRCDETFVICDKINLWSTGSIDEAWKTIINALHVAVLKTTPLNSNFIKTILNVFHNIFGLKHNILNEITQLVTTKLKNSRYEAIKKVMQDKKYVLVFDDLERSDFKIIQAMLPLFERLKALPNLIVICAIAEEELIQIFQKNSLNQDFVHGHLNKLFDLRIDIPALSYSAINHFQEKIFTEKYKDCRLVKSFLDTYPIRYDTARQMIRILDKLTSIERQFYDKCPYCFSRHIQQEDTTITQILEKTKYLFLVEALKIGSPATLEILMKENNISQFLKKIPYPILPYEGQVRCEDDNILFFDDYGSEKKTTRIQEWINENNELFNEISRHKIVWSILPILRKSNYSYSNEDRFIQSHFVSAMNGAYARCMELMEWEKSQIYNDPIFEKLRYSEKISQFFKGLGEILEPSSQEEAIVSLFKYELNLLKQDSSKLTAIETSLEKEYDERNCDLSLCQLNHLSDREYAQYLYDIVFEKGSVKEEKVSKFKQLFINLFRVLSLSNQGFFLVIYFKTKSTENFAGYISGVDNSAQLFRDPTFDTLSQSLCFEYGNNLGYYMQHHTWNDSTPCQDLVFQAYKYTENQHYIEKIKEGLASYITHCTQKKDFVLSWIKFMANKYKDSQLWGGVDSSFTSKGVYNMMIFIKVQLKDELYKTDDATYRNALQKACTHTLFELEQDKQQWKKREKQQELISGLNNLIEMIHEIKENIELTPSTNH